MSATVVDKILTMSHPNFLLRARSPEEVPQRSSALHGRGLPSTLSAAVLSAASCRSSEQLLSAHSGCAAAADPTQANDPAGQGFELGSFIGRIVTEPSRALVPPSNY